MQISVYEFNEQLEQSLWNIYCLSLQNKLKNAQKAATHFQYQCEKYNLIYLEKQFEQFINSQDSNWIDALQSLIKEVKSTRNFLMKEFRQELQSNITKKIENELEQMKSLPLPAGYENLVEVKKRSETRKKERGFYENEFIPITCQRQK